MHSRKYVLYWVASICCYSSTDYSTIDSNNEPFAPIKWENKISKALSIKGKITRKKKKASADTTSTWGFSHLIAANKLIKSNSPNRAQFRKKAKVSKFDVY